MRSSWAPKVMRKVVTALVDIHWYSLMTDKKVIYMFSSQVSTLQNSLGSTHQIWSLISSMRWTLDIFECHHICTLKVSTNNLRHLFWIIVTSPVKKCCTSSIKSSQVLIWVCEEMLHTNGAQWCLCGSFYAGRLCIFQFAISGWSREILDFCLSCHLELIHPTGSKLMQHCQPD